MASARAGDSNTRFQFFTLNVFLETGDLREVDDGDDYDKRLNRVEIWSASRRDRPADRRPSRWSRDASAAPPRRRRRRGIRPPSAGRIRRADPAGPRRGGRATPAFRR